ncbi:MAG: hypothetical protein JWO00_663 [Candidatus Parcubacteria bacterium]|nr:hypothetical protein [Candidatus Parcubacteria bacterium]
MNKLLVSLILAISFVSSTFAQGPSNGYFLDKFDNTDGWTPNVSPAATFAAVPDPSTGGLTNMLKLQALPRDYFPPDQPQNQLSNFQGGTKLVDLKGDWIVGAGIGVPTNMFVDKVSFGNNLVPIAYDAEMWVQTADGNSVKLILHNGTSIDPQKMLWTMEVNGVEHGSLSYMNPRPEDVEPQSIWSDWQIKYKQGVGVSFVKDGVTIDTISDAQVPDVTSISLEIKNQGFENTVYVRNVTGAGEARGFSAVPEPATYGLLAAISLMGFVVIRRIRSNRQPALVAVSC